MAKAATTEHNVPSREALQGLDRATLLRLMHIMLLIRRFEEPCDKYYRAGKMGGYIHYYIGQEAVATGIIPLFQPGDLMITHYRDHGYALALGTDPKRVMAELFGRATGVAGGKGGSMHLVDVERGFLGGYGIVGGTIPLGVGAAFALKYQGKKNICASIFGDGSMQQGVVHESMNMAGLYKVPCLFVLENNGYAMGTAVARHSAQTDFVKRVTAGYNIKGESVDGMDVLAVRAATNRILAQMRETGEPYFLEARTYRYAGHGYADNAQQQKFYRTEAEIDKWRKRDPIEHFREQLLAAGVTTEAELNAMDEECKAIVADAIEFADTSPFPSPDSLYEHVYTDM
ncbi:MAG TPA: pyruvate dehydrogenase (acetyl-transferring) E1 component subunit alpha [Chthonomonadaceae bacterium]|nr:pyruvate dehydrogenase (acetyl-transferring) E1 component subunit alpha [Chthonomonadaceae bacterium]